MHLSVKLVLLLSHFWISTWSQITGEKYQVREIVQGYVAEWDFEEKSRSDSNDKPPPRTNPATWLDSSGTWWLFGGQSPTQVNSSQFLGDLWSLHDNKWTAVFRPVSNNPNEPMSSYPENLSEPTLCGSLASGHLAVFGRSMTYDRGFFEDNTVWLYDIPKTRVSTYDVWTSYICCDECLQDKNTSLEFCPRFDQGRRDLRPLVWCSVEGLMALNHGHETIDWWKFDLGTTDWVKLPSAASFGSKVNLSSLFDPTCKTVSDYTFAYVVCAVSQHTRAVYVLSAENSSVQYISTIKLTNAFTFDPQIWSSTTVLTARKVKGQTIIALSYLRLLDFWIHDHSTNGIFSLENLWQGESLKEFQHSTGFFYQVALSLANETSEIYILNPRNNLTFDPENGHGKFIVRIVPDTNVFLPDRDPSPDSYKSTRLFDNSKKPNVTRARFTTVPTKWIFQSTAATLREAGNISLVSQESSTDPRITATTQRNFSGDEKVYKTNISVGLSLIPLLTKKISLVQHDQINETGTDPKGKSNLTLLSTGESSTAVKIHSLNEDTS